MRPLLALLPAFLAGALAAQAESTTLSALCERAHVVVSARALATGTHDGVRQVTWRTLEALRGATPATFVLREPAGDACGRALAGVVPGQGVLLFLRERDGALEPAAGGGRACEPLAPEVLAFVRAWLAAPAAGARARRLAAELAGNHPRVRRDAALALAVLPGLEQAGLDVRLAVAAAVPPALDAGDPAAASLLRAAVRLQAHECVGALVERHLAGADPAAQELLAGALAELPGTAPALAARMPAAPAARRRAVALLARLPVHESRPLLVDLLRAGQPGVAVHAGAALAVAGFAPEQLAPELPADVLAAARALAQQPPRFRVVRPGGTR